MRRKIVLSVIVAVAAYGVTVINSCTHQPYVLPSNLRSSDPNICFETDVLPVFQSNCAKSGCHDAESRRAGYALNSYANIMKRGIVPGNPAASELYASVTVNKGENFMPRNGSPLTSAQLYVIRRWIAAGAVDSGACATGPCDTANVTYSGTIAPIMETYCTGCHSSTSAPGGSLMSYPDVMNAAVNGNMIGDITHASGYNNMPQGGAKLGDCEITQIKKWVAAGAPNN